MSAPSRETTIASLLREATSQLSSTIESAEREAQLLLAHALGVTRATMAAHSERAVDSAHIETYRNMIARRAHGEPIAYITGHKEFWSLDLCVTPATLIPRPETETLVERALALIPREQPCRIADLGTGSGAIALALAHDRPRSRVVATDISADALTIARANARRLGIANVEFHQGAWFECLADEHFDLIVSNPPYVAVDDPHLKQGDLRFEPITALTCGEKDDLAAVRHIAQRARAHLVPGGWLLLEHGHDQSERILELATQLGYRNIGAAADLSGIARVAYMQNAPAD